MVDPNSIKERIVSLANGSSQQILPEMRRKVDEVDSLIDSISGIRDKLPPNVQFSLKQLNIFIKNAEQITTPIDAQIRQVRQIESKPGIKRYNTLQTNMKKAKNPRELGLFNREISQLKMSHSTEISKIVSLQQQILVQRLSLIECWKSMVVTEIGILDEVKTIIEKNVIEQAKESGDPSVIQMVQEKLDSLKEAYAEISSNIKSQSHYQKGNIKVLKESLKNQLVKIVQIEKAIDERQSTFSCLVGLAKEFKSNIIDIPDDRPKKPAPIATIPTQSQEPKSGEAEISSVRRMVYQSKGD